MKLFPDALPTLRALKAKYPLGLITNGPADVQRQEIATLGIVRFFDNIFIEGEMLVGKPEPEVFRKAEAAVGLRPQQILFVG
ncbi:HAD-IA family hydrolase, partial [Enterococcus faecalis]|uniref:HAD-IA family hydrolase n=1 Tax=Enterococcus faecalis TaxID=1351 RepID=UPI00403FA7CE